MINKKDLCNCGNEKCLQSIMCKKCFLKFKSTQMKNNNPMHDKIISKKVSMTKRKNGDYLRFSESMKKNNPMKNKTSKEKMLKNKDHRLSVLKSTHKKKLNGFYKRHSEYMKNGGAIKARKNNVFTSPNKSEKTIIKILKDNKFNFDYVGNSKIWFKNKDRLFNPDFICKKKKLIIEVFGDYWHNRKKTIKIDKERLKTYFRYGYKTLIIWQHELKNEEKIINRIREFTKNGKD